MSENAEMQYNNYMTRLFGTTPNKDGFEEMKMYAQPVCVNLCTHGWVKLCVLMLFVWAYVVALLLHVVVSWLATEDSK